MQWPEKPASASDSIGHCNWSLVKVILNHLSLFQLVLGYFGLLLGCSGSAIMLSRILPGISNKDIGRKFPLSKVSPFLYNARTLLIFHRSGNLPSLMLFLMTDLKLTAANLPAIFSSAEVTPFGP